MAKKKTNDKQWKKEMIKEGVKKNKKRTKTRWTYETRRWRIKKNKIKNWKWDKERGEQDGRIKRKKTGNGGKQEIENRRKRGKKRKQKYKTRKGRQTINKREIGENW